MVADLPDWTRRIAPRAVQRVQVGAATATEAGSTITLAAGVPGQRIGVVSVGLGPALSTDSQLRLRDTLTVWVRDVDTTDLIAVVSISPEQPSAYAAIPEGAGYAAVGGNVEALAFTAYGSGSQGYRIAFAYFLEG